MVKDPLTTYLSTVREELASGEATESTYYPALERLLETLDPAVNARVIPRRRTCGSPDIVAFRKELPVGCVEAKDVGRNLDEIERTEQLERYLRLPNLVLTDFLEFRWYTDGECRAVARLGSVGPDRKIRPDRGGVEGVRSLLLDFLSHESEPVTEPRELAQRMARFAQTTRDLIEGAFASEVDTGALHSQYKAFRDVLLPDLTAKQFADMYAQTITYGLFAACCAMENGKEFTRKDAAYLIPKTNPFLRNLFNEIAGPNLDDRIAWIVDDLTHLLNRADMVSILEHFGKRKPGEDPVVHFYETFLTAYDPKVRERRGVYYTPEPVVSYIVRSVDHILRTRFSRTLGLADPNTLILDPAAGTGTFLYFVIEQIRQTLRERGRSGAWNEYVAEKLLPRVFGFELLMAPYAVAHLKLGLLLRETGYRFQSDQRLGIYLTNTLEEAAKKSEVLFARFITDEANAAAEIKREKPIMVILGNPPYSGHSANKGVWIDKLVRDYYKVDGRPLGEKNPKWLQDDYVKFIRFAQWRIERTGQGILGFVTNHSYLDNPTFRGMRQSLMETFDEIHILDLHGSSKKKETSPDGSKDENVFDIQQGVAIALFVKLPEKKRHG